VQTSTVCRWEFKAEGAHIQLLPADGSSGLKNGHPSAICGCEFKAEGSDNHIISAAEIQVWRIGHPSTTTVCRGEFEAEVAGIDLLSADVSSRLENRASIYYYRWRFEAGESESLSGLPLGVEG
jgi:hypothetical protein